MNQPKEEKGPVIVEAAKIEVTVEGEVLRRVTYVYYRPITYGLVLSRIENVRNEYSDFSSFDRTKEITESITIIIPSLDKNNEYQEEESSKMNIHHASKEELMKLYQVGEKRAEKIINYISTIGKIASWDKLKEIISVSEEAMERIKEQAVL